MSAGRSSRRSVNCQRPPFGRRSFTNVLWMATRKKLVTTEEAAARLVLADGLGIHTVPNRALWQGALVRACQAGIAAFTTHFFVELAARGEQSAAALRSTAVFLRSLPDIAARPGALPGA